MSKYYKDTNGQLYVDPILEKHQGLVEITEDEFMALANPPKTPEQLAEEARLEAKQARDTALNELVHVLPDGSVVQTRPSDLPNFEIAIATGLDTEWVLADNTVRTLTVAEMQECLSTAIEAGKVIWKQYTDFLKAQ